MKKHKKNPVGRPPLYSCVEDLQKAIDGYFKSEAFVNVGVSEDGKKKARLQRYAPTITGLVLFLGFCDRRSFYDLEKNEKFSYTIKKARTRIEQNYERLLQGSNCTGAIFALKNFDWKDTAEVKHTGSIDFQQEEIDARNARIRKALVLTTLN